MFQILSDWIRKKFGYHVCEEFTQWEFKRADYRRTHTFDSQEWKLVELSEPQVFTKEWQERRCTQCGKIEQQPCL